MLVWVVSGINGTFFFLRGGSAILNGSYFLCVLLVCITLSLVSGCRVFWERKTCVCVCGPAVCVRGVILEIKYTLNWLNCFLVLKYRCFEFNSFLDLFYLFKFFFCSVWFFSPLFYFIIIIAVAPVSWVHFTTKPLNVNIW